MQHETVDFQQTQPLGQVPKVDLLVDPMPARLLRAQRRPWRSVSTGLDFLRDLLTYRFS